MRFVATVVLVVCLALPAASAGSSRTNSTFVTRSGTHLTLDGKTWRFTGMNVYNANSDGSCWYRLNGGPGLGTALSAMGPGVKVIRAWFFQAMATTNGQRDWSGFDHTLAVVRAHNVKVIATLANQWPDCEPASGYKDETWYTAGYKQPDPSGTVSYRAWAGEVAARYRNDPTILAWQLINEAEVKPSAGAVCSVNAGSILKAWASDVSSVVKAADPNHLVSLGTIGGGQCGAQGAEYQDLHSIATVDLCEFHDYGYPNVPIPGDQWNGLQVHISQCKALGKPLFVGESGIIPSDVGGYAGRAAAFKAKIDAEFRAGVVGYLPWAWSSLGSTPAGYDIGPGDPVLAMLATALAPPPGCRGPKLVIGAGAGCDLLGGTFSTVTVKAGGSLRLFDANVSILQAGAASSIEVQGGSVTLLQVTGTTGPVIVNGVSVAGIASFQKNTGGVALTENDVGGILTCRQNTPAPTGGGNTAPLKTGQCSTL